MSKDVFDSRVSLIHLFIMKTNIAMTFFLQYMKTSPNHKIYALVCKCVTSVTCVVMCGNMQSEQRISSIISCYS